MHEGQFLLIYSILTLMFRIFFGISMKIETCAYKKSNFSEYSLNVSFSMEPIKNIYTRVGVTFKILYLGCLMAISIWGTLIWNQSRILACMEYKLAWSTENGLDGVWLKNTVARINPLKVCLKKSLFYPRPGQYPL